MDLLLRHCVVHAVRCACRLARIIPPITAVVNVVGDAPASVINQAVVTGGGELNNSNNIANDTTTIVAGTFSVSVSTNIPGL